MLQRSPGKYRSAQLKNLPMEGDMIKHFPHMNANDAVWVLLSFGIAAYAVALLARVLQSYSPF